MSQASIRLRADAPFALLAPADRAALPADATDAYPLSALQSGVLFEAVSAGQPGVYHDVLTYRMSGALDVAAFSDAVGEVVRRHPICRTSFHLDGFSEPVQVVHDDVPPPLRITDLRGMSEQDRTERLAAAVDRELADGFRYGTPDLVRFAIHLLSDEEYQYTLSYHDAAIDSASVRIINHDLFAAYLRLRSGTGDAVPPEPSPAGYRDFVAAERAALAAPEQARFWLDRLEGSEGSRIPRYGDVPADTDTRLVIHAVDLPDGLAEAVLGVAADLGVPVPAVLTAAHVRVLSLLTGSSDVLTGFEHSGRPATREGARCSGLFLNTLPLRVRCQPGSWRDLIGAVHEATLAWQPHHRFPMPEIKRRLGVRGPLMETVCNVTSTHSRDDLAKRYGFVLPRADLNARTEFPFRAEFGYDAEAGEVRLSLHYHADQFSAAQVDRIAGYYRAALRALGTDPRAPQHEAVLLDADERRLVTGGLGGPHRATPAGTVVDLFGQSARRWPDRTALVHGDRRLSYADLRGAAESVADRLAGHGLVPGAVCAVALPRGIDWAVTALAVLLRAGVYLPVDPTHPPARIAASAARAGATLVVTDPASAAAIERALAERGGPPCQVLTAGPADTDDRAGTGDRGEPVDRAGAPVPTGEQDAYILFTSGSTGEPKGARITHAGMLNHLLAKVDELDLGPDDRIAQTASQCFDISVWQLLTAWTVGARTVIYDTATVTDAPAFLAGLSSDGVTVVELVPSYLDAMLVENARQPRSLPRLRYGIVTGEPVPVSVVRRWFEQVGVPLVNAYGPTEAADDVTHLVLTGPVRGNRVPVGRPIRNTGVHVLGPDGRHRPIGCYGEIVVTGVGVGRGYVNDPERSAEVFCPNTVDDRSALMYRTGDVGRWLPDGVLDCAGRLDDQVKLRGFRIELAEVEGAITALPGVDGAVAVVTDTDRLAVGYVGPATLDTAAARAALSGVLPGYMLPDTVVALDRIPLTPNGKVDRARLATEVAAVGSPGPHQDRREFSAPVTATERHLAELVALVLNVPATQVGLDDDFFAVGGHSLAAMKLAARSDGRLALRDIVTHPTVRAMARLLDSESDAPRPLLIGLTDAPAGGPALVCAPYAGGGAVNFLPMARVLARRAPHLAVYGIEPPGRTRSDPLPASSGLDRALVAVADELSGAGHDSVAVLGHCSGAVLAVRLAGLLERRGVHVTRVFAAAKVLSGTDPAAYATDEFADYTDQAVVDWVRTTIGMVELDDLGPGELADLAQAFRTDSVESTRMLHEVLSAPDRARLGCPLTQVVALDDALTAGHVEACRHWGVLADDVTATTLPDGGHYFNRTRPEQVANLVADALGLGR